MKIGHTLNRDKRPEILGWSPSRDCQTCARSLSKAQTRMSAGSGKREVLSISLAQLLLAKQAWQPWSTKLEQSPQLLHYCVRPPTTIM